jgi:ATP-binding cassette, subfamily C (CFTR/MRP), member 1
LLLLKIVAFVLLALQIANVVREIEGTIDPWRLVGRAVSLTAAVALCPLSFFEHGRNIAPSAVLTIYLVFSVFRDVIQVGLLYVAKNMCGHSPLPFILMTTKLVLLVLEGQTKRSILREQYKNLAPEMTDGFFGTAFFVWVNKVFALGYSKILSLDDMPPLATYLDAMVMRESMQKTWDNRSE